jgi:pyruvate formate lyase activating enzyme
VKEKALIFDIKRDCSEDGPGIRTAVFFKGCPLSCTWCQNPEGIDSTPGISFNTNACCAPECNYPCISVCNTGAILTDHPLKVEHKLCNRCDRCFSTCPTNALEQVGRWITVEELLYDVCIDKLFYASTGGGVTLTGGEPTLQMCFIEKFLRLLKEKNIHTAIETCGFFKYEDFRDKVLPFLDLIYFDIKLISDTASRKYTGRSNHLILENLSRLIKESEVPLVPRIPLIPGVTTTKENLEGIATFLRHLNVSNCSLMPYNPLWIDKSNRFGFAPKYKRSSFMTKTEEEVCMDYFLSPAKTTSNAT